MLRSNNSIESHRLRIRLADLMNQLDAAERGEDNPRVEALDRRISEVTSALEEVENTHEKP